MHGSHKILAFSPLRKNRRNPELKPNLDCVCFKIYNWTEPKTKHIWPKFHFWLNQACKFKLDSTKLHLEFGIGEITRNPRRAITSKNYCPMVQVHVFKMGTVFSSRVQSLFFCIGPLETHPICTGRLYVYVWSGHVWWRRGIFCRTVRGRIRIFTLLNPRDWPVVGYATVSLLPRFALNK